MKIVVEQVVINIGDDTVLQEILSIVQSLQTQGVGIMADLSALEADVTANGDAVASAVALLQGLKAALDAAGTDPAALAQLSADLESNTNALAAAVTANTPAAPTP